MNDVEKNLINEIKVKFDLQDYTNQIRFKENFENLKQINVEKWKNIPKCISTAISDIIELMSIKFDSEQFNEGKILKEVFKLR